MKNEIRSIHTKHQAKFEFNDLSSAINNLYKKFIHKKEKSLLDAVAATGAINALFLADRIDHSSITPAMEEAFYLKYPNLDINSLSDYSPEQLKTIISNWKGKYFEVLVRDKLNQGESIGEIQLGSDQTAVLGETGQEGWDL